MNRQLSLNTLAQTPFIFLKEAPQSIEPYGNDFLVKWSEVWHNSGGSKPEHLKIWSTCGASDEKQRLDFSRQFFTTTTVIGPQSDRTIEGCETSYSYVKSLEDENSKRARASNDTRIYFYLFGGADYRDFLGVPP